MRHFLRTIFGSDKTRFARKSPKRREPSKVSPTTNRLLSLTNLEDRSVPATFTGTSGIDSFSIGYSGATLQVQVTSGGSTTTYPITDNNTITINAGNGNDTVYIDGPLPNNAVDINPQGGVDSLTVLNCSGYVVNPVDVSTTTIATSTASKSGQLITIHSPDDVTLNNRVGNLNLNGTSANDNVYVNGPLARTAMRYDPQLGQDNVTILTAPSYTVTPDTVNGVTYVAPGGGQQVTLGAFGASNTVNYLGLNGTKNADTVTVNGPLPYTTMRYDPQLGNDSVTVYNAAGYTVTPDAVNSVTNVVPSGGQGIVLGAFGTGNTVSYLGLNGTKNADTVTVNGPLPYTVTRYDPQLGNDSVIMYNAPSYTVAPDAVTSVTNVVPGGGQGIVLGAFGTGNTVSYLGLNGTKNADTVTVNGPLPYTVMRYDPQLGNDTVVFNDGAGYSVVPNATGLIAVVPTNSGAQGVILGAFADGNTASNIQLNGGSGGDTMTVDPAITSTFTKFTMNGNDGDDVLTGGAGDDSLYGGAGNDRLYGRGGSDTLQGGTGINLLYGGLDSTLDTLSSGGGKTIFAYSGAYTNIVSGGIDTTRDAVVGFLTGGKAWAEPEVEGASVGLFLLGVRTQNTKLSKLAGGAYNSQAFFRYGPSPVTGALAGNAGSGHIEVYDLAFTTSQTVDPIANTIIHEIGHNWDETTENSFRDSSSRFFSQLSGWQYMPTSTTGLTQGPDTDPSTPGNQNPWWYATGSAFVSSYAKFSPYEDYAESLASLFNLSSSRYTHVTAKDDWMNAWLNNISG